MPAVSLGENSLTEAASHMGQLGKRKFLNFNKGFNNCRVHRNPLLREENTLNKPRLPEWQP